MKRKILGEQAIKKKKEIMEKFDKTMNGNKEMNVNFHLILARIHKRFVFWRRS